MPLDLPETVREAFRRLHEGTTVPGSDFLATVLDGAQAALDREDPTRRPRDRIGRPGGLVLLEAGIPTIVVPDLHARTGYLSALIDFRIGGRPVLERLAEGSLQVVCVGDGFHSEARGARRWRQAWEEYRDGYRIHEAMDAEMRESLALMAMVLTLKSAFPNRFDFLKGNHENLANAEGEGNRPFGKYAWEGQMVRDWFLMFLGDDLFDAWCTMEASLPLLAVGGRFLISHAEPRRVYGRRELIEYRGDDELIFDLTWTGNGEAEDGSVDGMLTEYLGADAADALYFGGHRPVRGTYELRGGGRYVQIHNPERYVAAVLESGRPPDPRRDILVLDGGGA